MNFQLGIGAKGLPTPVALEILLLQVRDFVVVRQFALAAASLVAEFAFLFGQAEVISRQVVVQVSPASEGPAADFAFEPLLVEMDGGYVMI